MLLVTPDLDLTKRLVSSMSELSEGALTILCVNSFLEAIRRLNQNDSIDAVILDCDLPALNETESLLALIGAAPHLPIIVLGDERSLVQQMGLIEQGAQDYLLKRRLNAETLVSIVYIAIARHYRNFSLFCDQARAPDALHRAADVLLGADVSPSAS